MTAREIRAIAQELARILREENASAEHQEEWLDTRQAAAFLRVAPQTLYNKRAELPRIKMGSRVRYRKSDLIRYRNQFL